MAVTSGASSADAQDAAVAGGIGRHGGEDGHGGVLAQMQIADASDGLRPDQRHIAGEHQQMLRKRLAREREVRLDHLHGVAGAALLLLQHELHAGGRDGGLHALGLVADDAVDVLRRGRPSSPRR